MFWRIQYELFGMNAVGYHVVLVALHLANTALVWFIAKRLFNVGWAANLAALIFALHPAYVDAVTWLSGGNRTVAALPLLGCVASFIAYRSATRWRSAWYAASLVAYLAAILLHSSALGVALVLPAYAAFVDGKPRDALRPSFWLPFLPFFLAALAMTGIQVWVRDHLDTRAEFEFGWHQYRVLGQYLGFAFVPVFAASTDIFDDPWRTAFEGLQGIASVAAIVLAVWLLASRRWWGLGLLTFGWLIVALLPDSTFDFPVQGRLLYMPGIAFALFIVTIVVAIEALLTESVRRQLALIAPVVMLVVLLPTVLLTIDHTADVSSRADGNQRFARELRKAVPDIPEGGALYIANPPLNLYIFGLSPLEALVEIYYGKRAVQRITPGEVESITPSLGEDDRLFVFQCAQPAQAGKLSVCLG
jgi:hypothetical protein